MQGFFGVLLEAPGIILGFDFVPSRSSPTLELRPPPPHPPGLDILLRACLSGLSEKRGKKVTKASLFNLKVHCLLFYNCFYFFA